MSSYDKDREILRAFRRDTGPRPSRWTGEPTKFSTTIELDQGVHRSILFSRNDSSAYHFRLNTWPGHLSISGDMGTFTFARLYDMFDFFPDCNDRAALNIAHINPQYWGEKVQTGSGSAGRRGSILGETTYSMDAVKRAMLEEFQEFTLDDVFAQDIDNKGQSVLSDYKSHKMEALSELHYFLDCELSEEVQSEAEAFHEIDKAREYEISGEWTSDGNPQKMLEGYDGYELIETDFEYSYHYIWCCYAILWGIKQYFQIKEGRSQDAHTAAILAGTL